MPNKSREISVQKLFKINASRKTLLWPCIFLLVLSLIFSCANAQTVKAASTNDFYVQSSCQPIWEKTYGGTGDDRAFYATQTSDNGFLIVGSTTSIIPGKTVAWIVKTDSSGNALWNRTYYEGNGTEFRSALNLGDGFLLVGNTFSITGNSEGMILRVDENGNVMWNLTVNGTESDKTMSAAQTSDGFVIVGVATPYDGNSSQAWVMKISFDGKLVWNKLYGKSVYCAARAVVPADNGSCVVAGETGSSTDGNYAFWYFKLNEDGSLLWNSTYAGQESQRAIALCPADDGYIIVGNVNSVETDSDALMIKVDLNGNLIWNQTFGGSNFDMASDITKLSSGGYAITGFTFSSSNYGRDLWLFQIDESGQVIWNCVWGHPGYQEAYCICQVSESNFAVFGWTSAIGNGSYDYYAVQLKIGPPLSGGLTTDYIILGVGSGAVLLSGLVIYVKVKRTRVV